MGEGAVAQKVGCHDIQSICNASSGYVWKEESDQFKYRIILYMKYEENTWAHASCNDENDDDDDDDVYMLAMAPLELYSAWTFSSTLQCLLLLFQNRSTILHHFTLPISHKYFVSVCSSFQQFSTRARRMHKCINNLLRYRALLLYSRHTFVCVLANSVPECDAGK